MLTTTIIIVAIGIQRQEAHSPSFLGGLYQPTAASFYPAKVVYALAREARKLGGVQIMTNTPVLDITEDQPHHYRLRTTNGGEVTTSCVVHATNAWYAPIMVVVPLRIVSSDL
jgi:glycine/D-amino acid oxidase-like deaminating enzyme